VFRLVLTQSLACGLITSEEFLACEANLEVGCGYRPTPKSAAGAAKMKAAEGLTNGRGYARRGLDKEAERAQEHAAGVAKWHGPRERLASERAAGEPYGFTVSRERQGVGE
jgi:hypothetical protein